MVVLLWGFVLFCFVVVGFLFVGFLGGCVCVFYVNGCFYCCFFLIVVLFSVGFLLFDCCFCLFLFCFSFAFLFCFCL